MRTATGVMCSSPAASRALALLPRAGWGWTIPPQILVGAGLGLTLAALTEWALAGRSEQVIHGGWTIAVAPRRCGRRAAPARPGAHLRARPQRASEALRAGAAAVLDSQIPPLDKLRVAQDVLAQVDEAKGELPDVAAVVRGPPGHRRVPVAARRRSQDQLDRAVTDAFSAPFALAAALALAALVPVGLGRREQAL